MENLINVNNLKKGDYFKFEGKNAIYLVSGRKMKTIAYDNVLDMLSGGFEIKKTSKRKVIIGFDY
ncbi:hypothetical protein Dfri01_59080 [Dyadobacter frigoris]|uniref:hypothetical protein n=1 Tax=Dyadobacter frigoris TaxID=2576211 RepID=UPI0024A10D17|nr:hypothetical protein [Dyadobacter frigoris]GLU56447.1 hypothetical protein Dfri01_59080 [Dyadobacter frigoris]